MTTLVHFSERLETILRWLYPNAVFDWYPLRNLIFTCLLIMGAVIAVALVMKCMPKCRPFTFIPVLVTAIILLAGCAFFPRPLSSAGIWVEQKIKLKLFNMIDPPAYQFFPDDVSKFQDP